jgi:hypothetical protein
MIKDCAPSHCEDPKCSNQWPDIDLKMDDHLPDSISASASLAALSEEWKGELLATLPMSPKSLPT